MIERYLVRYFLAVADQGSFSLAARQCHVSQPTLSVGIAKLEALLGTPLFERSNRQVRRTAAGDRFLGHARRIENEFNLARTVAEVRDAPFTRLGVLNSIPGPELARIAALALARSAPGSFELVPGTARELRAKLDHGRIDAALTITSTGTTTVSERALRTEGFGLFLPSSHHLAGRSVVRAEDVADEVMIVRRHCESLPQISRHFADQGIRPHFALRSTNDDRVLQMIAVGLGITVMPLGFQAEGVRSIRLHGFDLTRTLGLAFSPSRQQEADGPSGIVDAVVEIMAD